MVGKRHLDNNNLLFSYLLSLACPASRIFRLNACWWGFFYAHFLQNISFFFLCTSPAKDNSNCLNIDPLKESTQSALGQLWEISENSVLFIDIDQWEMFFIVYVEPFCLNVDSFQKGLGFICLINVPNMLITDHKTKYFCI